MARLIRSHLYNRKGAAHFGEYFFLLSLGGAFLLMTSGYLSRRVAGSVIDFSGVLLGKPSRTSGSEGSTSKSWSSSTDNERTVGTQDAHFVGNSTSGWSSSSGFTLATDKTGLGSVRAGACTTISVNDEGSAGCN